MWKIVLFFFKCGKEWEEGGKSGWVWIGLISQRKEQGVSVVCDKFTIYCLHHTYIDFCHNHILFNY